MVTEAGKKSVSAGCAHSAISTRAARQLCPMIFASWLCSGWNLEFDVRVRASKWVKLTRNC